MNHITVLEMHPPNDAALLCHPYRYPVDHDHLFREPKDPRLDELDSGASTPAGGRGGTPPTGRGSDRSSSELTN